ncbi:unnamed protein product [Caenorhabditis bovis]|uniref:ANK_REP_REGION domain-containing protein n=1 Tax=Caenorhabditis bovis TaxID=2654633 RepID=A0A8S1F329_9PELO|nr:unnamed protein product [Caenorhabditis bovis]
MSAMAADGIDDRDIPKMELLEAAFNSDLKKIDSLMRDGQVHIDSTDDDDVTALHIAAAMGNTNLVRRLLDYGANIEACNQLGLTPFLYAAREGKLSVIDVLLQKGADYRKLTYLGVNALTLAAAGGHADVVKKLLSLRDENWRSAPRNRYLAPTPLIAATCFKSSQICNTLIRAGASPDETVDTLNGLSALSAAILCTPGVYMVSSLLDLGSSPTKRTLNRMNAMELATRAKRKDIVNMLYEKKNARNDLGAHRDIRKIVADDELTERLVDQPSQDGCTLLMFAIIVRSINSAKWLLQKDADVNAKDNMHITALHYASHLRVEEIIPHLLSKNARTIDINKFNLNAYDLMLRSSEIGDTSNIRSQIHPYRPAHLELKLSFSASSSSLYKTLQPKGWLNKVSSQIFLASAERAPEAIEPRKWLDAIAQYQPARDRNATKFACVEDILRGTKSARPPESNPYDIVTDAARSSMEECQSFMVTFFCDAYGEKEDQQRAPEQTLPNDSKCYDVSQYYAQASGYPPNRKFARNSLVLRRRDSVESVDRRGKPRNFAMVEHPSQNQMRTTPRMLKKSRDVMGDSGYGTTSYSARINNRPNVPTVVVHPKPRGLTNQMIWDQFICRNKHLLMKKLQKEEIDRFTFMELNEANLMEMNILQKEDWIVIRDIQQSLSVLLNP